MKEVTGQLTLIGTAFPDNGHYKCSVFRFSNGTVLSNVFVKPAIYSLMRQALREGINLKLVLNRETIVAIDMGNDEKYYTESSYATSSPEAMIWLVAVLTSIIFIGFIIMLILLCSPSDKKHLGGEIYQILEKQGYAKLV